MLVMKNPAWRKIIGSQRYLFSIRTRSPRSVSGTNYLHSLWQWASRALFLSHQTTQTRKGRMCRLQLYASLSPQQICMQAASSELLCAPLCPGESSQLGARLVIYLCVCMCIWAQRTVLCLFSFPCLFTSSEIVFIYFLIIFLLFFLLSSTMQLQLSV